MTNKNSLTEMNCQFLKIETPQNRTTQSKHQHKNKMNTQDGNERLNQVLTYIPTKNITELNELIYAGAKLVCEKIRVPLKSMNKKSKPGWEIQLETQIRKLRKLKNHKTKENVRTCWDKNEKQYKKK